MLQRAAYSSTLPSSWWTVLHIKLLYMTLRCSCLNGNPLFTQSDLCIRHVTKVGARESRRGCVINKKAIFSSSPWTPAQWPRLWWTHPDSPSSLSEALWRERAAHKEHIHSHYILSMELESLNDSFLPRHSFVRLFFTVMSLELSLTVPVQLLGSV